MDAGCALAGLVAALGTGVAARGSVGFSTAGPFALAAGLTAVAGNLAGIGFCTGATGTTLVSATGSGAGIGSGVGSGSGAGTTGAVGSGVGVGAGTATGVVSTVAGMAAGTGSSVAVCAWFDFHQ